MFIIFILFKEMVLVRGYIFVMCQDVIKCMEKHLIYVLILDGTQVNDLLFVTGNTVVNDLLDQMNSRYKIINFTFLVFLRLYKYLIVNKMFVIFVYYRDIIEHIQERRGFSVMNVLNGLCVVTTYKNMLELTWNKKWWYE